MFSNQSPQQWIKKIYIAILTGFIVIIFGVPALVLILLPLQLYKKCVRLLAKIFRPDLLYMLNTSSTSIIEEVTHEDKKFKSMLMFTGALSGDITLEQTIPKFQNLSPETRAYLYSWCGYQFWKKDEQFNIQDHIRYYQPFKEIGKLVTTNQTVDQVKSDIFQKSFRPRKSPWEVLIFPNYLTKDGQHGTMFLLRFHHSMCDGLSLIKVILKLSDDKGDMVKRIQAKTTFEKLRPNFLKLIWLMIWGPFVNVYDVLLHVVSNRNAWKEKSSRMAREYHLSKTLQVPLSLVKDIKNFYNVAFGVVTLAATAGAVRKMMISQGMNLPKKMSCHTLLPRLGHPEDKLTNHVMMAVIFVPIEEPDPVQRLQKIQHNCDCYRNSLRLFQTPLFLWLIKGLPFAILKFLNKNAVVGTIGHTNVAGCQGDITWLGKKFLPLSFSSSVGLFPGACGLCTVSFGFQDALYVNCVGDKKIFSTEESMNLYAKFFKEELDTLAKGMV